MSKKAEATLAALKKAYITARDAAEYAPDDVVLKRLDHEAYKAFCVFDTTLNNKAQSKKLKAKCIALGWKR